MERPFELRRRVLGEGHPDTLGTLHSVAELYRLQGKYTQAWPLFRKVLELRRRVLGGEHRDTLSTMNDFALLYLYQGKYAQSEAVFAEVLRGRRRVLGEQHLDTLSRAIWRCYTGTNENIQTPAVAYEGCGLAAARARCRASGYADQHE